MTIKLIPDKVIELNPLTKYPKLQTLWERDDKFKVVEGNLNPKLEAIRNIKNFVVTEKYHGTNLGIVITPDKEIYVRKRSKIIARALPSAGTWEYYETLNNIKHYLSCFDNVDFKKILSYFEDSTSLITIFGEGVGKGIQKHWQTYTDDKDFIVFDIKCGNSFFDWKSLRGFCKGTGLRNVVCHKFTDDILKYNWEKDMKIINTGRFFEGYVVRSEPPMLNQFGARMMFKIKHFDFKTEAEKNRWK
jgi:hypothetical protein|tara:strand:- start:8435 stop:9172 length:738 start_codon:yes stop_codon:yes gene_type:complete